MCSIHIPPKLDLFPPQGAKEDKALDVADEEMA